jgi:hypothetical protein
MAPDQRGEVGDVVVVDIHALLPDVANGFLHVDGVPVDDGIEGEAQGTKLLFLPLLKWAADFPAFAMVDAPAEAMAQFRVVELGQNAPPKRRIVDVVKNMDCLGDPVDFGKCASETGGFIPDLECSHDSRRLEMLEFQRAGEADHMRPEANPALALCDRRSTDRHRRRQYKGI